MLSFLSTSGKKCLASALTWQTNRSLKPTAKRSTPAFQLREGPKQLAAWWCPLLTSTTCSSTWARKAQMADRANPAKLSNYNSSRYLKRPRPTPHIWSSATSSKSFSKWPYTQVKTVKSQTCSNSRSSYKKTSSATSNSFCVSKRAKKAQNLTRPRCSSCWISSIKCRRKREVQNI